MNRKEDDRRRFYTADLITEAKELARQNDNLRSLLARAADEVLNVADYLNDCINAGDEIYGSRCVDPLMILHGELLDAAESGGTKRGDQ